MKLSRTERWILSNQYLILEKLDPDYGYDQVRRVIEEGFELEYEQQAQHIYGDDYCLTETECKEVLDVLSMYARIQSACRNLDPKPDVSELSTKFFGYDGNGEVKFLGYAQYLCGNGRRFTDVEVVSTDLNSHMPIRDAYKRQLREFRNSSDPFHLSASDVERIVGARTHPANREPAAST